MTTAEPTPFAAFISGSGRTLRNLADHIDSGHLHARICRVIASRPCPGEQWARERGIDTLIEPGVIPAPRLDALMRDAGAQWGVLAGYLRLLDLHPSWQHRFVNIHPALLPSFGGPGWYADRVHRGVIEAGCKVSGCTVHLCDAAYDTGPILAQRCCEVLDSDTPESLAQRVFALECNLYPTVLNALFRGRVSIDGTRARIIPG